MQSRIVQRAAAVVVGALLCLGVAAASANGFSNYYCGALINQGSWCGDGSNHSYDFNRATYNGGGAVFVCERLLIADTSTQRKGPGCAYNYVEEYFSPYPYLTEAEVAHFQSGGARHTIYGLGIA